MLNLYFNTKIFSRTAVGPASSRVWITPVMYPSCSSFLEKSQLDILLETILSYRAIEFELAVFNIEIDGFASEKKIDIQNAISQIKAKHICVNWVRPSTPEEWLLDVAKYASRISANAPVLVVMNHDHPFVDYDSRPLLNAITSVFTKDHDNLRLVLYYSHAPEVISSAISQMTYFGKSKTKFTKSSSWSFVGSKTDTWLDSICIMTFPTLSHIWERLEYKGSYIARIDWPGAVYHGLGIIPYVFCREFFKHYDGYGHVSTIRMISECRLVGPAIKYPHSSAMLDLTEFYYQRWIDVFLLSVRDMCRKRRWFKSQPQMLLNSIEESLGYFYEGYISQDVKHGLVDQTIADSTFYAVKNQIYFDIAKIYTAVDVDLKLLSRSALSKWFRHIFSTFAYMKRLVNI